jgi:acetyl-CoA acetyltransferase family protein
MALTRTYVPYGAYWSTPFVRWQGSIANVHSMELAAQSARKVLAARKVAPEALDGIVLGITVPQRQSFYGAPWLAGMLGAPGLTGPTVNQACATSVRALVTAALEVETSQRQAMLVVTCDRTSNGPHVYYPNPGGPGGTGRGEDIVLDSFNLDPWAGGAMIATAETVAKRCGISREEQDEVTLLRYEQHAAALASDRAFQRRYMVSIDLMRGSKVTGTIEADEGVHPTTKEGLAGLKPVQDGGTVTFGSQTHPADGNAGVVLTTKDRAATLSRDPAVTVQVLGWGEARVEKGHMPMAPVPAARQALERAGVRISDCKAIKTHNPFAVNDVYFCREMDVAPDRVNRYGSSLVYGHPQAPTGLRAIIELIEELAIGGGGVGLFTGCAAGDSAMALVVRVG